LYVILTLVLLYSEFNSLQMLISGGVTSTDSEIELRINVTGGKSYKRIYNDVVANAINKFVLISDSLHKILTVNATAQDIAFYVEQLKLLLQRAHVELIPGDRPFQNKYNLWLLDGYIRMLVETTDMKLIAQLLDIDAILYSLEEASIAQDNHTFIDFNIPPDVKPKELKKTFEVAIPITNEARAYLNSLDSNLKILREFIIINKEAFVEIHRNIISIASKYLH